MVPEPKPKTPAPAVDARSQTDTLKR
jgi:hypothetical protein